ncbi:MAG: DUF1566 domain-containing protein [Deltaproteobacteria bacterium]|nr:DUF1566 domain-containing protein [Deltaproteobacteria bacterium]
MYRRTKQMVRLVLAGVGLLSAGWAQATNTGGLPLCQAQLTSTQSQLNSCQTNLSSTQGQLNTCSNSLNTCSSSLSSTQGQLTSCNTNLTTCNSSLTICQSDLTACEAEPSVVFPGDGETGPLLSYMDNGDGTFTDNNTQLMWEEKDTVGGSIHNVDNTFQWSNTGTVPDGSLFTTFLATLNNTCDGGGVTACTDNTSCGAGVCGFASHRDWRIPNIKELESIMDYSKSVILTSFPGAMAGSLYWSFTTYTRYPGNAYLILYDGEVYPNPKESALYARAVRGGQ